MSVSVGNQAEEVATQYLKNQKYKVLERNWRTRVCEIDIVAKKNSTVFFIEVKYRSTDKQGGGLEYITSKKLQQMQFAAQCWVEAHDYLGDYELGAMEVSGKNFEVTSFLPNIS